MIKRKSFGLIKNDASRLTHQAISFQPDGEYRMGSYAFRPVRLNDQCTSVLYLEVVTAIADVEIIRSVYEVREYSHELGKWHQCSTPYVTPFCVRTEAFIGMQQYLRRMENPAARIIHAEYFVDYVV